MSGDEEAALVTRLQREDQELLVRELPNLWAYRESHSEKGAVVVDLTGALVPAGEYRWLTLDQLIVGSTVPSSLVATVGDGPEKALVIFVVHPGGYSTTMRIDQKA
ncbi:hypothetical protein HGA91_02300 [candidate division WWE3 bacterium]|nr:hypothetical protein [candidate division WWE3 bacterium]